MITGDLVHGPELSEHDWPDYLGSYYRRRLEDACSSARCALAARYPGRVHYLLGNHEHAHVGGPVVAKFFPDEARRLEELLGDEGTRRCGRGCARWPFVAVAPKARLVMLHAAPHARIESADDLERLPLEGFFDVPARGDGDARARSARCSGRAPPRPSGRTPSCTRSTPSARVAVYGHDVARAGYAIEREPLLCISTSFGCFDGDKLYLEWDLAEPAETAPTSPSAACARCTPSAAGLPRALIDGFDSAVRDDRAVGRRCGAVLGWRASSAASSRSARLRSTAERLSGERDHASSDAGSARRVSTVGWTPSAGTPGRRAGACGSHARELQRRDALAGEHHGEPVEQVARDLEEELRRREAAGARVGEDQHHEHAPRPPSAPTSAAGAGAFDASSAW